MTSWTRVPHDIARLHPLHGIKGWAALLAVGLVLGPIRVIVAALGNGAPEAATRRYPWLSSLLLLENTAAVILAGCAFALFIGLINHKSWFRRGYTAFAAVVASWPLVDAVVVSAVARSHGLPVLISDVVGLEAILGSAGVLIWMAYANLSVRIRVTCESMVPYGFEPPAVADRSRLASLDIKPLDIKPLDIKPLDIKEASAP